MPGNGLPPAAEVFPILSGGAEMWQESDRGCHKPLRPMVVGEFFGGPGIARHRVRATAVEYAPKQNGLAVAQAG